MHLIFYLDLIKVCPNHIAIIRLEAYFEELVKYFLAKYSCLIHCCFSNIKVFFLAQCCFELLKKEIFEFFKAL